MCSSNSWFYQGELEAGKRELTAVGEKERQTRVKNKHLSTKLKHEEDEVLQIILVVLTFIVKTILFTI